MSEDRNQKRQLWSIAKGPTHDLMAIKVAVWMYLLVLAAATLCMRHLNEST
jgi:hypothetical protein